MPELETGNHQLNGAHDVVSEPYNRCAFHDILSNDDSNHNRGPNSTLGASESSRNIFSSSVFQNEDIIELILSFFDPEAFWGEGIWDIDPVTRTALFFACLTARSFVLPATNLLWRMMPSFILIFRILPTFKKESSRDSDVYTIGTILPDHLARLASYSCKVQYLYLQSLQESIDSHLILRLSSEKNFTLFPALKTLYIPSLSPYGFRTLDRDINNLYPLFLVHGLALTTLILGGISSSTELFTASFLSVLPQKAIAVQDLILSGKLSLSILSCIPEFSRLQSLNITFEPTSMVPSVFIRDCSSLPVLSHLIINLNQARVENSYGIKALDFPSIQELRLTGDPMETHKIIQSFNHTPSLKTVILACTAIQRIPATASWSIETCVQWLARIASALQVLEVDMGTSEPFTIVLSENSLRPLIQCRDLVNLEISGVSLPITDYHITELCSGGSWQNLCKLSLPPSVDGKSPSLLSLQIIAQSCPQLLSLSLPIDFRHHPPHTLQELRRQALRSSNVIEQLSIHKITTGRYDTDPNDIVMGIAVARFIEHCLPRLKVPFLNVGSSRHDVDWWRTVQDMISEFRAMRSECLYSQ